jgi:uncharacterized membrane protein YbhN (UPF0104 family)
VAPVAQIAVENQPLALGGPPLRISGRRALVLLGATALGLLSLALLLPALGEASDSVGRVAEASVIWLVVALAFKVVSFLGNVVLFRTVALDDSGRIDMRASLEITLAGHAATRLFASAGAGGVVLTAWALRRAGMTRAEVGTRMTTFLVLLYGVYMAALVVGGLGLYFGLLPGDAPLAMTLVPAAFGALVIILALALPRLAPWLGRHARLNRFVPAAESLGTGVHEAKRLVRRADWGLVGALLWWAGDIAVLWACFEAFGASPAIAVLVVAYFVGMFANTLPLPGGVGGVDGGMVAALVAFGTDPGLAIVAVLAYRLFAFWLPIAPGIAAWVSLRKRVAAWA